MQSSTPTPAARWPIFALTACANALILWLFHDRYWYPSDEGIYAHLADRLIRGEVMNRDFQSLHPGYINFVNAGAFRVFGDDLLSMRYPLVAVAFLQSCLAFDLFARRSVLLAAVASLMVTALGVVQFLNPSANWYCLALVFALIWWLQVVPRSTRWRIVIAGVFIGALCLFRQLSGLWAGLAVLVLALAEESDSQRPAPGALGKVLVGLVVLVLVAYLVTAAGSRPLAKLMTGLWPVALAGVAVRLVNVPNRVALSIVLQLAAGAGIATLPLMAYLLLNGAVTAWFDDAVLSALRLAALDYMSSARWSSHAPLLGLIQMLRPRDLAAFLNGFYWFALTLAPAVNGLLTLGLLRRGERLGDLIVPVTASFYAIVSLHLDGSMYWYFSAGLSGTAVLWHAARRGVRTRGMAGLGALVIAATGLYFHAGQSALRSSRDIHLGIRSRTTASTLCGPMQKATLRIEAADCEEYRRVVDALKRSLPRGAAIFALPSDPEFYFLTDLVNPFRFYNTATALRGPGDVDVVLRQLRRSPPEAIVFRTDDKFNTAASAAIMTYVRSTYRRAHVFGSVEIYLRQPTAPHAGDIAP